MNDKVSIEGSISNIRYYKPETKWGIFEVKSDKRKYVVSGILNNAVEGSYIVCEGKVEKSIKFGETIKASSIVASVPKSKDAIIKFLESLDGIGSKRANDLYDTFGDKVIDKLKSGEELVGTFGLTQGKLQRIQQMIKQCDPEVDIMLNKLGFGEARKAKIYNVLGEMTGDVIKRNPYELANISGITLRHIDEHVLLNKLMDPNDERRQLCLVNWILDDAASQHGHTYLPSERFYAALKGKGLGDGITELLSKCVRNGNIRQLETRAGTGYGLSKYLDAEARIAKKLLEFNNKRPPKVNGAISDSLNEEQKAFVEKGWTSGVSILTGGPGCGKTFTINEFIKPLDDVVLLAPTGKAARRMSEATGHDASTIHSWLLNPKSNRGCTVVIDESSMLDVLLLDNLLSELSKIKPARIVFVGDADQLPSVDAGNTLKDLIDSNKFNTGTLTKIMRQSEGSMISVRAKEIRTGEVGALLDMFNSNATSKDFKVSNSDKIENLREHIVTGLLRVKSMTSPKGIPYDPVKDVQVLSPMNEGVNGCEGLNSYIQERLNPAKEGQIDFCVDYGDKGKKLFRVGDKVIFTKNNKKLDVVNGNIGYVTKTDTKSMEVNVDDSIVRVPIDNVNEVKLGYAITVHKSQGSEAPVVFSVFHKIAPMLQEKALLYTAITRARDFHYLLSTPNMIKDIVTSKRVEERYTSLKEALGIDSRAIGVNYNPAER